MLLVLCVCFRGFASLVNIDGAQYDLSPLALRNMPEVFKDDRTGMAFLLRPFGSLNDNSESPVVTCKNEKCYPQIGNFSRELQKTPDGIAITLRDLEHWNFVFRGKCNKKITSLDFNFSSHTENGHVVFDFEHSCACPLNVTDPFYPPFPLPAKTTPTPLPSSNPVLFVEEGDVYVAIDLSRMDNGIRESTHVVHSRGDSVDMKVYRSNWLSTSCPKGYDCGPYTEATWWGCWTNERGVGVCFPIADKRYGVSIQQQNESISSEVHLRYEGHSGVDTELILSCDPSGETTYFELENNASFHVGLLGYEYGFRAPSGLACPKEFQEPVFPFFTPSPNPRPGAEETESRNYGKGFNNGTHVIWVDLTRFSETLANVSMGWSMSIDYEKTQVKWAPHGLVDCIYEESCEQFEKASAWKCWQGKTGNRTCIPIGDMRYGLSVKPVMMSNLDLGLEAKYMGGLGGYRTTFVLQCNESVPDDQVVLLKVAIEMDKEIVIYAQTGQMCLGHQFFEMKNTPGAIFLLTVISGLVVYFFIGVLVGMACKRRSLIPNIEFWSEFFRCVETGGLFIFTCNRVKPSDYGSYTGLN